MIDFLAGPMRYIGGHGATPFGYVHFTNPHLESRLYTRERYERLGTREDRDRTREDSNGWRNVPIQLEREPDSASASELPVEFSEDTQIHAQGETSQDDVICLSDPWLPSLFLTQKDREELESNTYLSDKHTFAAQKLLQKQFPKTRGLQDTCLSQTTFESVALHSQDGAVVQIHHTRGNHWVVSAFMDGEVLVYDSLYRNIAPDLVKQLKEVYKDHLQTDGETEKLRVIMPSLNPQKGGEDCGVFTAAYAYELCCGRDPALLHFDQKQMRKHLKLCFQKEEISRFPIVTFLKRDRSKDSIVYL